MRKMIVLLTVIGAILFLFVASAVAQDQTPIQLTQQQATATADAADVYRQETIEAFGPIQRATATAVASETERKIAEEVALLAERDAISGSSWRSDFAQNLAIFATGFFLGVAYSSLIRVLISLKRSRP